MYDIQFMWGCVYTNSNNTYYQYLMGKRIAFSLAYLYHFQCWILNIEDSRLRSQQKKRAPQREYTNTADQVH